MFNKQNLLVTLAGTVVMFLLGYVIWGMATMSFFEAHSNTSLMKADADMDMLHIFLGNLVATFAMSSLYGTWAHGNHSAGGGFTFGAWIGLLIGLGLGLLYMGTSNMMDATGHFTEAALDIVFYGIVGAVIALVYKRTAPKAA